MKAHPDKFAWRQHWRSVLTVGTSTTVRKYIRIFKVGGDNPPWVELWLDNGTLLTVSKHGSGADGHPSEFGTHIKQRWDETKNRSFLQHSIHNAQGTTSMFVETKPLPGVLDDKVLFFIHSLRPTVSVTTAIKNPPYPTNIGSVECQKLSAKERARRASLRSKEAQGFLPPPTAGALKPSLMSLVTMASLWSRRMKSTSHQSNSGVLCVTKSYPSIPTTL